jgi:hypothetical protein
MANVTLAATTVKRRSRLHGSDYQTVMLLAYKHPAPGPRPSYIPYCTAACTPDPEHRMLLPQSFLSLMCDHGSMHCFCREHHPAASAPCCACIPCIPCCLRDSVCSLVCRTLVHCVSDQKSSLVDSMLEVYIPNSTPAFLWRCLCSCAACTPRSWRL